MPRITITTRTVNPSPQPARKPSNAQVDPDSRHAIPSMFGKVKRPFTTWGTKFRSLSRSKDQSQSDNTPSSSAPESQKNADAAEASFAGQASQAGQANFCKVEDGRLVTKTAIPAGEVICTRGALLNVQGINFAYCFETLTWEKENFVLEFRKKLLNQFLNLTFEEKNYISSLEKPPSNINPEDGEATTRLNDLVQEHVNSPGSTSDERLISLTTWLYHVMRIFAFIPNREIPAGYGDGTESRLYPTICRANHSCMANAKLLHDGENPIVQLLALDFIPKGEEITINYGDAFNSQSLMWIKHRYEMHGGCHCKACTPQPKGTMSRVLNFFTLSKKSGKSHNGNGAASQQRPPVWDAFPEDENSNSGPVGIAAPPVGASSQVRHGSPTGNQNGDGNVRESSLTRSAGPYGQPRKQGSSGASVRSQNGSNGSNVPDRKGKGKENVAYAAQQNGQQSDHQHAPTTNGSNPTTHAEPVTFENRQNGPDQRPPATNG